MDIPGLRHTDLQGEASMFLFCAEMLKRWYCRTAFLASSRNSLPRSVGTTPLELRVKMEKPISSSSSRISRLRLG